MAAIEISNVVANASVWAPGQTATITFTMKNVSGVMFTQLVLAFVLDERDFTGSTSSSYTQLYLGYAAGTSPLVGETVNLANYASKTFTVSFVINDTIAAYFADYPAVRAVPLILSYKALDQSIGGTVDFTGYSIINGYYTPLIADFSLERADGGVPSDEGEGVLATARLSVAREGYAPFLRAILYYAQNAPADTGCASIDLSGSIGDLIAGVNDSASLITQTFSNGSDWDFLLVFGDDYENTSVHCTLGRAFANLHLSGVKSGGACFGGFSSSQEGSPKLESYYPAHFYGGIQGVSNYELGEAATGGAWIDGKPIYRYVLEATTAISNGQGIIGTLPGAIDTLIRASGTMMTWDGGARPLTFGYFGGNTWTASYYISPANEIYIQLGGSYISSQRVVIVLEYTQADAAA